MQYKKLLEEAHKLKAKCEVYMVLNDETNYLSASGQLIGIQNTLLYLLGAKVADNKVYLEIVEMTDYVMGLATEKTVKELRLVR